MYFFHPIILQEKLAALLRGFVGFNNMMKTQGLSVGKTLGQLNKEMIIKLRNNQKTF